ncbi:MAG: amidophosphoribosyltransferase [Candidatus Saganbacteria bacterium]|uniref:Amidophosphoribosyltransferase n=1 Tax=Candidatus Saganbacteria bacterium TaxID=2575572 RepID=A0A833NY49_UNCSA|nr:MAG: amidophosphoribosyltransferase [Candidatus Saganbacteria bacterium]
MCGNFAVSSTDANIIDDLFLGTFYLQHRGQKYCGLSVYDGTQIKIRTHKGLVRDRSFSDLTGMGGFMGIGSTSLKDCQPLKLDSKMGEFTICFSGNIINREEIVDDLKKRGHSFYTDSDIEIIAKLIAQGNNFVDGIENMAGKIRGSYALVLLSKNALYAARDKYGFRPLVMGIREGSIAVSSESCAFCNTGFIILRDVEPGEILEIKKDKYETKKVIHSDIKQYCSFEWVYTANVTSIIDGSPVDCVRRNIGAALAKRYPVDADIVAAVPNSGIGHAIGYSQESKIPFDNVFIKYDYASRSYTQPTQEERDREAKIKLIPVSCKIKGRKVVICDDSIVRGTQFKNDLVVKLRRNGISEIHARIACPPLKAPCLYGVATRSKNELIAAEKTVEEIRKYIGIDSLAYATIEDVAEAIGKPIKDLCLSCWTDQYKV